MRAKMRTRLWLVLALLFCFACGRAEDDKVICPDVPEGMPVSEAELSYLSLLRAHHKAADIKEQLKDLAGASEEMAQAMKAPRPNGSPSEDAYLDVASRATALLLRQDKASEALQIIQTAEKVSTRDSFYFGALQMAKGEVYETLAKQRETQNDAAGAEEMNRKALDAYEDSQRINGRVLDRLQPKGGAQ
jgi:hypothetical protein